MEPERGLIQFRVIRLLWTCECVGVYGWWFGSFYGVFCVKKRSIGR